MQEIRSVSHNSICRMQTLHVTKCIKIELQKTALDAWNYGGYIIKLPTYG